MPSPGLTPPSPTPSSRFARTAALAAGLAVLAGFVPAAAVAVPAERVADVHPGPATGGTENWIWEADFEPFDGRVYFSVDDGVHGNELWATDGTLAGTGLVSDVCPGVCSSNPLYLTAHGGLLLFRAEDGVHGRELWVSDGTAAGTRLVVDLMPGLLHSGSPTGLTVLGGRVVFAASSPGRPRTLWSSDGTAAGTVPIGGTDPATTPAGPIPLAVLDGRLVFAAGDPDHGFEPWATDGTPEGTVRLGDLRPGPDDSFFSQEPFPGMEVFAVLGDRLLFAADDGATGLELWSTDGTPGGTGMVADVDPGFSGSGPGSLEACAGRVFFRADDGVHGFELWSSDGTAAGTAIVVDAAVGAEHASPLEMTCVGDRVFYTASDAAHGREPWVSDGTAAGTGLILDVRPGPDSSFFLLGHLAAVGDRVTFFTEDGTTGIEPWVTDGTAAGTERLQDIFPGPGSSAFPLSVVGADRREVVGGEWYFRAFSPEAGIELWLSDGTPAGTRMIEINRQSSAFDLLAHPAGTELAGPGAIAELGGLLLMRADDGVHGTELWRSDGTAAGTELVRDLVPGPAHSQPQAIRAAADGVILAANSESCCDGVIWVSDGTPGGTVAFDQEDGVPLAEVAALLKSTLFFVGGDGLWRTDGTIAGTGRVADVDDGGGVEPLGDWVYFAGGTGQPWPGVSELWRTDGVAVEPVADIVPGADGSQPRSLVAGETLLFFSADDGVHGRELWVSDGTADGTTLTRDVRPGPGSGIPGYFTYELFGQTVSTVAGDKAFFLADDGVAGEELWVSDGTEAGTFLLRDVFPGARSSEIRWLTAAGKRVYFVAEDGVHGRELWNSDGTPGGTALVADLVPGSGSSLPDQLAAAEGRLYFTAHTPAHGREPWVSDGTAAGTVRLDDIAPGPLPSSPLSFTRAGDWLYFAATDAVSGFELWRLPLVDGAGVGKGQSAVIRGVGSTPATRVSGE